MELKEKTFLKQQQNQPCFIGPSVWAVRDIAEMRMWRLMNGDTLKEGMINDYIYQKKKNLLLILVYVSCEPIIFETHVSMDFTLSTRFQGLILAFRNQLRA